MVDVFGACAAFFARLGTRVAFADDAAATISVEQSIDNPAKWLENIIEAMTNNQPLALAITGLVCIIVTALVASAATKLVRTLMEREFLQISNTSIFVNIIRVIIWCLGISVVLSTCFGVDVTAVFTALGIGGIAISLGLQDTIANLIGGLQVSILGLVKPGDYIVVGGQQGVVQDVFWRHTVIKDFSGTSYVIPNKSINAGSVTILPPSRKIKVEVDFNNNDGRDLEELKKNMLIAVKNEVSKVAAVDHDPVFRFSAITEYCFKGLVIIWVNTQPAFDIFEVQDAIVRACAPYARASEMTKELIARPKTKGALQKTEGYEELVNAKEAMAEEYLSEEDFMRVNPTKAAIEAAAAAPADAAPAAAPAGNAAEAPAVEPGA
ncbi:MAG: mechanosensitive ion channel [Eggerthellaceae bacterium]|nr:mechanosensitive ion channel [Eggerthellaceae bacterium]